MRNLLVCCDLCCQARGVLDDKEFREICQLIAHWPRPVRQNFLTRLRAGASAAKGELPVPGSLEWFTGADSHEALLTRGRSKLIRNLRGVLCREEGCATPVLEHAADGGDYEI